MPLLKHRIADSIISLGAANAVSQVVTWTFTILIARLLTPADYGLIAMAAVFIAFSESINEFGIGAAIVQKQDLTKAGIRATYTISLLLGTFFTAITFVIAPLLSLYFKEQRLVAILDVLSVTFIISSIKITQHNLMIRNMKFRKIAIIEVAARIFSSSLAFLSALRGFGVWALVIQYLSYNFCQTSLYALHERILPGRIQNTEQLRDILLYGFRVMIARMIRILSRQTDSLIIGKILGTSTLGIYSFSRSLANKPVDKIMSVFNQVLFPVFSRTQQDIVTLKRYFLRAFEIKLLIIVPIFTLLFLIVDDLVPFFLGQKWITVIFPLKIFLVIAFFEYLRTLSSLVALSMGKPQLDIYFNVATLLIMTTAMIVLGSLYQLNGILLSWAVFFTAISLTYFLVITRSLKIDLTSIITRLALPFFLVLPTCFGILICARITSVNEGIRILLIISLGLVSYISFFYIFAKVKFLEILDLIFFRTSEDGVV